MFDLGDQARAGNGDPESGHEAFLFLAFKLTSPQGGRSSVAVRGKLPAPLDARRTALGGLAQAIFPAGEMLELRHVIERPGIRIDADLYGHKYPSRPGGLTSIDQAPRAPLEKVANFYL
jgi:hypothetical protein